MLKGICRLNIKNKLIYVRSTLFFLHPVEQWHRGYLVPYPPPPSSLLCESSPRSQKGQPCQLFQSFTSGISTEEDGLSLYNDVFQITIISSSADALPKLKPCWNLWRLENSLMDLNEIAILWNVISHMGSYTIYGVHGWNNLKHFSS